MSLPELWFIIIAVLWTGYFVLEGFDLGVGMLHRWIGRTETDRRVAVNAIGPVWDGNEVWLIVAGAGIFAAFPSWYATWFSAAYLALLLLLVALIIRGVSFEWRGKVPYPAWRGVWSWTMTIGSVLIPVLLGVALGDLLYGLPIDANEEFTGSFVDLLTPYGVWLGVTMLVLCLLHGSTFLGLKTLGDVRTRSRMLAIALSWPSVILVIVFVVWTHALSDAGVGGDIVLALPVLALIGASLLVRAGFEGWSFAATAIGIGGVVAALFWNLYPNVMVSSTNPAYNLTVDGTASGDYALKVMTIVALVLFPLVLVYQGWSYYVFRTRVTGPPVVETTPIP
jgi:cytochrome d ubiquinol oxidase subunit II